MYPSVGPAGPRSVRAQDRPLQNNIPQWHIDYFELKLLDKQPVPEGHLAPLSPWMQEINLPVKGAPVHLEEIPLIARVK